MKSNWKELMQQRESEVGWLALAVSPHLGSHSDMLERII